jgi:hypothetical protein
VRISRISKLNLFMGVYGEQKPHEKAESLRITTSSEFKKERIIQICMHGGIAWIYPSSCELTEGGTKKSSHGDGKRRMEQKYFQRLTLMTVFTFNFAFFKLLKSLGAVVYEQSQLHIKPTIQMPNLKRTK